jgi:hypothetical protein
MTLADFQRAPWQNSHQAYKDSVLSISPAPEYASSEVILASLYRTIGFADVGDPAVPQAGRDLEKSMQRLRGKPSRPDGASANADTWNTVLHGVLESPKLPNQSSKRFVQVTPIVPGTGLFSGSARLTSNSWPAGSLVRRMVCLGSPDIQSAQRLWEDLFAALSVGDGDDIFARWLEAETNAWVPGHDWKLLPIAPNDAKSMSAGDYAHLPFLPARQFVQDLAAVIRAKDAMTRRQWTSLLESVIRLAGVAHVAWLCDVHARAWRCLSDALSLEGPRGTAEARHAIFPQRAQYMTYGGKAQPALKDKVSGYLVARLGINSLLWCLESAAVPFDGEILSSEGVAALCEHIRANHPALAAAQVRQVFLDAREREARALNCKKGIGANMLEFARHVLGQRQAASPLLRGYDQGYILKKKGTHASSPWVVSLGPVAVLALVHCAMAGLAGPRSIHRLARQLAAYGVAIDRQEIASSDLGHQLRMLGLVLDSPDAESGMLLIPPFPSKQSG